MVLPMRDPPRVIGKHEEGVDDESDKVVVGLILRESTVTTFVSDDPLRAKER